MTKNQKPKQKRVAIDLDDWELLRDMAEANRISPSQLLKQLIRGTQPEEVEETAETQKIDYFPESEDEEAEEFYLSRGVLPPGVIAIVEEEDEPPKSQEEPPDVDPDPEDWDTDYPFPLPRHLPRNPSECVEDGEEERWEGILWEEKIDYEIEPPNDPELDESGGGLDAPDPELTPDEAREWIEKKNEEYEERQWHEAPFYEQDPGQDFEFFSREPDPQTETNDPLKDAFLSKTLGRIKDVFESNVFKCWAVVEWSGRVRPLDEWLEVF